MNNLSITDIKSILSKSLKEERFYHSLSVNAVAASLAMRYGADVKKAELAGLIHDCAKAYPSDCFIQMADDFGIELLEVERDNPQLIHAKLGAYYAKKDFGVYDDEILNAIIYHTTGRPNMCLLEKIIYIADYIEPARYKAKRLDEVRTAAFEDLDKCLDMILSDTVEHLIEKKYVINPITLETYKYYSKSKKENE